MSLSLKIDKWKTYTWENAKREAEWQEGRKRERKEKKRNKYNYNSVKL